MRQLLAHWRQFWRIAEMRLLFLALLVSVVAVSSVGFVADRADKAMDQQATQLLGGDLVIASSRPIAEAYLQQARQMGLQTAEMISFRSMTGVDDRLQLTLVKAVSPGYPLRGEVETQNALAEESRLAGMSELQGQQVWAESRLFSSLDVKPGDAIQLGRLNVTLSRVIAKMPDQGAFTFQLAPSVLLPLDQLPATGLLSPASRARFSQLYAGDADALDDFSAWLKPQLKATESIRTLDDGMPSIQQAMQRGKRFLAMAALLSVILAGAAIALASYSLNLRESRAVAVLKTLGASRRRILNRYLTQLLLLTTLAALLGVVIGYGLQLTLAWLLQDLIGQTLPAAGLFPVFSGFATAVIMAMGFSAPQLLQLMNIEPVHILQGQKFHSPTPYGYAATAIVTACLLLMWLQTRDLTLSLFLLLGTVAAIALFWLMATVLLKLLRYQNLKTGVASSINLPKANPRIALLVVVFGIGLFSLSLLSALRSDLLDRWQGTLPADAPNHFLINIQPDEVETLTGRFAGKKISAPLYPMIRARLTAINGKPVGPADYQEERAKRLVAREFNMSSMAVLPENNKLLGGQWFADGEQSGFSVEEGIAETLGFALDDTLTFDIAGQTFQETITSIRSVRWDSMQPNFFVLAAPGALQNYPRTYITSLHVPPADTGFIPGLIRQHPSITAIDISSMLGQVKGLIDKAVFAVQTIFAFTLVAGIIVLFAALQSQKAERRKELAIMKSIGASRRYLKQSLLIEFALIGAVAGAIAGLSAMIASNIAAYMLFELTPHINLLLIGTGMLSGALLVAIAGYLNMRPLLEVTPVALFQEV